MGNPGLHKSEVSAIESLKNSTQACQSGKQTRTSTDKYERKNLNNAQKTAMSA
jgi:hypothetical protein